MSLGLFDLTGGPFLALYIALLAVVLVGGFVLTALVRPAGRSRPVEGEFELAYLAGGARRLADAVAARLLATGSLVMTGQSFSVSAPLPGASAAELAVLGLSSPFRWGSIEGAVDKHARAVDHRLVEDGLLMDASQTLRIRLWVVMPFLALILVGATKLLIGLSRGRPVGFLTVLLIVTVVLAMARWRGIDRCTRAGRTVLSRVRRDSERIKKAPTKPEAAMAVALFGTAVLAGSALSGLHVLRGGTSGSGGVSGCGGGGGGCGGGCGGCGS
jgi:uncharacterized protein (TIGR04222 family)